MKRLLKQHLGILSALLLTILVLPATALAATDIDLTATTGDGYVQLRWTVNDQAYDIASFNVYKGVVSANTLLTPVASSVYSFDDYDVDAGKTYYYKVTAVDSVYGQEVLFSQQVSTSASAGNPHGYYDNKTTKCSVCHSSHEGAGPDLIKEKATAEELCIICHEAGGESEPIGYSSMENGCTDCHNPHGNNKDQKYVPDLLQVTLEGNVLFEAANPENGVGQGFCLESECHVDYADFEYNPKNEGTGHDSVNLMVYQQGLDTSTKISCLGCHSKHDTDAKMYLRKTISWNDTTYTFESETGLYKLFDDANNPITKNYNDFCLSCHEVKSEDAPGFPGAARYNDSAKNVHNNIACFECHDPHGKSYDNYLKNEFLTSNPTGSISSDFALCFEGCHDSSYSTTEFSGEFEGQSVNLHVYHLEEKDAVCKDCHSPHGATDAKNIGFPSQYSNGYITENELERPTFTDTATGGSCNLKCHGVIHSGEIRNYETQASQQQAIQTPAPTEQTEPTATGPESTSDDTYGTGTDTTPDQTTEPPATEPEQAPTVEEPASSPPTVNDGVY